MKIFIPFLTFLVSAQDSEYLKPEKKWKALNLLDMMAVSMEAVEVAGNVLIEYQNHANFSVREKTGKNDVVTEADEESNRQILAILQKVFPELKKRNGKRLRSEEVSDENLKLSNSVEGVSRKHREFLTDALNIRKSDEDFYLVSIEDLTFWIDPLDATKEYTEKLTTYTTVMIGIAVKGKPICGIIRKPFENLTVWGISLPAVKSQFGFYPENLTHSQKSKSDIPLKAIISRSHPGKVEKLIKVSLKNVIRHVPGKPDSEYKIIKAGGSGYKSIEVLTLKAMAYVHTGKIKLWDLCAPNAIIKAAGGFFVDLNGTEIEYDWRVRSPVHKQGVLVTLTKSIRDLFLEGQAKLKRKSLSKNTNSEEVHLGRKVLAEIPPHPDMHLEKPPVPAFVEETPPILSEQNELITSETLSSPPK